MFFLATVNTISSLVAPLSNQTLFLHLSAASHYMCRLMLPLSASFSSYITILKSGVQVEYK